MGRRSASAARVHRASSSCPGELPSLWLMRVGGRDLEHLDRVVLGGKGSTCSFAVATIEDDSHRHGCSPSAEHPEAPIDEGVHQLKQVLIPRSRSSSVYKVEHRRRHKAAPMVKINCRVHLTPGPYLRNYASQIVAPLRATAQFARALLRGGLGTQRKPRLVSRYRASPGARRAAYAEQWTGGSTATYGRYGPR
jgi:hypothetical protein